MRFLRDLHTRFIQTRALVVKELILFFRYPSWFFDLVVQPVLWILTLYFTGLFYGSEGLQEFGRNSGTSDYLSFMVVGNAFGAYILAAFYGVGQALKYSMWQGVFEDEWLSPLPRKVMLTGRFIASLITTSFTSMLMVLATMLFYPLSFVVRPVPAILAVLLSLLVLQGIGYAVAASTLILKDTGSLVEFSSFALVELAGASFPLSVLPWWLAWISRINPVSYALDLVRVNLLPGVTPVFPTTESWSLLAVGAVITSVAGSYLFVRAEKHVLHQGTLGGY